MNFVRFGKRNRSCYSNEWRNNTSGTWNVCIYSWWKLLNLIYFFSTAQEALIANLNSQLARKDPIHRTDQQVFEILTREEANREMHTLQAEVDEWKKRCQDVEKKLAQKNEEISTLQRSRSYIPLLPLTDLVVLSHNHYCFFFSQRMIYALSYKQKLKEGR